MNQNVQVPFVPYDRPDPGYFKMIQAIFCPRFKWISFTFVLIVVTFLCLIIPQFISKPVNYYHFLAYTDIKHTYMNTYQIKKVQKGYIYQTISSLFFHFHFSSWIQNVILMLLIIPQLENSWIYNILLIIFGGIISNCYTVLIINGIYMGSDAMLTIALGLYVGFMIMNCRYLMTNYAGMLSNWMLILVFYLFNMINRSFKSVGIQFLGIALGICYGLAFIPYFQQVECNRYLSIIFKVISLIISILPIILVLAL